MLGESIQYEVDNFGERMWRSSPLFTRTVSGTLDKQVVSRYVANILFLIRQSLAHISLARAEAEQRGDARLAAFYAAKLGEEVGHDQWALDDLKALGEADTAAAAEVTDAVRDLAAASRAAILIEPALYLGYMFFAEYLTVTLGPRWLAALRDHCGIVPSSLTVIDRHVELDKDHVKGDLAAMSDMVDAALAVPMLASLRRFMICYERFCVEVVDWAGPVLIQEQTARGQARV